VYNNICFHHHLFPGHACRNALNLLYYGGIEPPFFMSNSLDRIAESLERIANVLENETITINMIHGHIENIDHAHIDDGEIDVHSKSY